VKLSKAEQDYIKAIYEFQKQSKQELVSLKQLVEHMQVSAPTVTEMVKRIEKKGLIVYQSYKGVYLTDYGLKEAIFILKAHRVWEYFLLDILKYQEQDVHEEAEALEHAATPRLIERLYSYLGKPEHCPHGQSIPQEVFWYEDKKELPLHALEKNRRAEFSVLPENFLTYVAKLQIDTPPTFIKIIDKLADGTFLVELDKGKQLVIPQYFQKDVKVTIYEQMEGAK
jgi:Mn-dependent transcriptional regulator